MQSKNLNKALYLALLIASLTGRHSDATSLVALSPEDLTHASDLVVVGQVSSISGTLDGITSPGFSFITLTVLETLKGSPTQSVTLKLLGGQTTDDPKTRRVEGVPLFAPRQRAVFFLFARPEEGGHFYNVTGWTQGKWNLTDDDRFNNGSDLRTLREKTGYWKLHPKPSVLNRKHQPMRYSSPSSKPGVLQPFPKKPSSPKGKAIHTDRGIKGAAVTLGLEETAKRDAHRRDSSR